MSDLARCPELDHYGLTWSLPYTCAQTGFQPFLSHHTRDRFLRNTDPIPSLHLRDFGTSIKPSRPHIDAIDPTFQILAAEGAFALRTLQPLIITAPRYTLQLAHLLDRKLEAVFMDELVPYFRSKVLMRMAFLRSHSPPPNHECVFVNLVVLCHPGSGFRCRRKHVSGRPCIATPIRIMFSKKSPAHERFG